MPRRSRSSIRPVRSSELLSQLERALAAARSAAHVLAAFGRSASQDELGAVDAARERGRHRRDWSASGSRRATTTAASRSSRRRSRDRGAHHAERDCRRRLRERILARQALRRGALPPPSKAGDYAGALDAADGDVHRHGRTRGSPPRPPRSPSNTRPSARAIGSAHRRRAVRRQPLCPTRSRRSNGRCRWMGRPGAGRAAGRCSRRRIFAPRRPNDVERVVRRALGESPPPAIRARLKVNDAARWARRERARRRWSVHVRRSTRPRAEDRRCSEMPRSRSEALCASVDDRKKRWRSRAVRPSVRESAARHRLRAETRAAIALLAIGRADEGPSDVIGMPSMSRARKDCDSRTKGGFEPRIGAQRGWTDGQEAREAVEEATSRWRDGRPSGLAVAFTHLAQLDGLMGWPRLAYRRARAALPGWHVRTYRNSCPERGVRWRRRIAAGAVAARRTSGPAHGLDEALRSGNVYRQDWGRIELGRSLAGRRRWDERRGMGPRGVEAVMRRRRWPEPLPRR